MLDKGAEYDGFDKSGQSSLMKACKQNHDKIVKQLIAKGADYDRCDIMVSPLSW